MQTGEVLVNGEVWVYKNGVLIRHGKNLIVNAGYALICALTGSSGTKPGWMSIGTSGTIQTVTQIALIGSEQERVAASVVVSGRSLTISATFGAGVSGTQLIKELGIFNAASNGTMLSRFTCQAFTITSSDSVAVSWQVVFGGNI